MRVLHLIPYMHPSAGGPPVVVDRWCRALVEQGIESAVLSTDAYAPRGSRVWIDEYAAKYPIDIFPLRGAKGFGFGHGMAHFLRSRVAQYDLVHVHNVWSYANLLAATVCPRRSVPVLTSTHGMLDPHSVSRKRWKKHLYGRAVQWPSLRRCAGLVFTHAEEERLARQTVSNLPAGYIVPLAADAPPDTDRPTLKQRFEQRFPSLRGKRLALFLGRVHPKKGLDLLIPAWAQVVRQRADDTQLHLVIAGMGADADVRRLRAHIARHDVDDRVSVIGAVHGDAKWETLAAADVFVLPSYQENFAIAVIEALQVGTPALISGRVNIAADLVAAGAAVRVELDANDIATQLLRLLDNASLRDRLACNGRRLAAERYTWQQSCRQLLDVYQRVLQRHG